MIEYVDSTAPGGAAAYVTKPILFAEILKLLDRHLPVRPTAEERR